MKKKWLITLVGLTMALAAITGGVATLGGGGSTTPEQGPPGDQPPIRSDEDIDPNECNWIHNITACEGEPEPGIAVGEPYPLPGTKGPKGPRLCGPDQAVAIASDGRVSCFDLGDGADMPDQEPGSGVVEPQPPVTIIDGMDPNECNMVHNINACFTDGQPTTEFTINWLGAGRD